MSNRKDWPPQDGQVSHSIEKHKVTQNTYKRWIRRMRADKCVP